MKVFTISLSVGTFCDSSCPYCDSFKYENNLATGKEIIKTVKGFLYELKSEYNYFKIRLTGGEPGLVEGIDDFLQFANTNELINEIKIFTKGDLFLNINNKILMKKCSIYEHIVHDFDGKGNMIRYDNLVVPKNLKELECIIISRKETCKKYKNIIVVSDLSLSYQKKLRDIGVTLFPINNKSTVKIVTPFEEKIVLNCMNYKSHYVYDISQGLYFCCCELKNPKYGKKFNSFKEFQSYRYKKVFVQCSGCYRPFEEGGKRCI